MKKNIEHILNRARPELTDRERTFMWATISSAITPPQTGFVLSPFSRLIDEHRRAFALALIVVLLVSGGATVVTAEAARPGDTLFPLDQAIERVRIRLARTDDDRGRLANAFTEERLGELRSIVGERHSTTSSTEDVRDNERVGIAVDALVRVMDESNMSEAARESVYSHLFTEIDTLSIDVHVDEQRDSEDDDHKRVKIRRDESGSKIEIRKEGTRTRIDKKDGKVRIDRTQDDDAFDDEAIESVRAQDTDSDTQRDGGHDDSTESNEGERSDEGEEVENNEQPEVRGMMFNSDDDAHERKGRGDDD
jgi:hypothetical protein